MSFISPTDQTIHPAIQLRPLRPPDHFPTTDPISGGTGLPLPLPDSGSMSLNSTSTESQNTLEPPFPSDRPRD